MMKLFNKFFLASIASSLLLMAQYAAADKTSSEPLTETWYQIEVLVYEPIQKIIAGEAWPAIEDEELPEAMVELTPVSDISTTPNTAINAFQQLAPETLNLAKIANKLSASRRYQIITLQGWQQPVKQRHEAESVHLSDKPASNPITNAEGDIILNPPQAETINTLEPLISDEAGLFVEEPPTKINGTVTVSLSRYLHMNLKLRYHNPDVYLAEQIALQKPEEVIIEDFMMTQSRRMRSKEVHVFDHPYFGVITVITPIERAIKQ